MFKLLNFSPILLFALINIYAKNNPPKKTKTKTKTCHKIVCVSLFFSGSYTALVIVVLGDL